MPEKIIRDPVHDVIAFRTERPADALLFRLLNASEFQRLRRVRQLGLASLAYPGADHSRYSHSLGVMQTARRVLDQLRPAFPIDPEQEIVCLVAALLHDLGHGPFSHVFERVSGIEHELLTQRIVMDGDSEIHRLLFQHDRLMPERVLAFLRCKPGEKGRTFFCDLLSSQLDADRLDYLLRDNLMTGSGYGDYDLGWLLHAFTVATTDGGADRLAVTRLAVTWKGVSAVEAYLQSRYHMYRNVYFHKVVRSAEGMVKLALQRARRLAIQGRLTWPPRDNVVYKALTGQRMTMAEFTDLDDVSVTHSLKLWASADDVRLATLCRGLLFRRVYKTIELTHLGGEAETAGEAGRIAGIVAAVRAAVVAAGGDPVYDLFYDEPADTPYEAYAPDLEVGRADEILVQDPRGRLTPFGAISPMTMALNRQLMFRRLHVAPQWKAVVEKVVGEKERAG